MGRPRKHNPLNLPPRTYAKHGAFYYHHPGPAGHWEHLGSDVDKAKKRANEIAHGLADGFGTMAYHLDEFIKGCRARVKLKTLSQRTLEDYEDNVVTLKTYFGKLLPTAIEPANVADFLDINLEAERGVRANREKACLSACFTWLIRKGLGSVKTNPCIGVKRNRETKRERYVEDDEMRATLAAAPAQVQVLAELVYRTLQRPEDIIHWTKSNLVDRRVDGKLVKVIHSKQGKTGAIVDIEVTPQIEAVLAKMKAAKVVGMTLIHRRDGKPYTYDGLSSMLKRQQTAVRKEHAKVGGPLAKMPSWGFYDMKAKGATDMWLSGVPLEQVQVLCGHDSITTTEIYCKGRWRGVISPNKVVVAV